MTSAKVADRYLRYNATFGPATPTTLLTARCGRRDPPCTRQSLLILAAFRPWGGSQGERHTGGRPASLRAVRNGRRGPVSSSAEDSPSGLGRTIGNRVGLTPSGVQIPYPPPAAR